MASLKRIEGGISFEGISKATITDVDVINNVNGPTTSIVQPPLMDPKERKRQRERDRYAQLSSNQKDELLRKCREARQQKKVVVSHVNVKHHGQIRSKQSLQKELRYRPTTLGIKFPHINIVHTNHYRFYFDATR
ncbi:hypothetical protein U9M48_025024 [Paspalum notatum var. saurae]|uniref:Uncharacterized protein n=1 Tax=Paspalum notatum var. saurae TaxID=547442 RepID=A0AAQ3TRT7_PASNO